ncbi:hypothetical protein LZF95_21040 [Algoriphagus sp. AGSA1]|uniref:hypothetical protein n=1 Tax=Algoriphagus sp. AGSA1 TaxID=2907213 RepID=UPI001F43A1FC|nr:hypothetical protein [Algoriphagus sp. AGSA1]MCE7057180.1 hypothetical protein [Algoriphagus sp. AGSA1]
MKNRVCKVVYTFLCLVTSVSLGYAQTNLFPPSGNVGIGTTSPITSSNYTILDIKGKAANQGGYIRFATSDNSGEARIFVTHERLLYDLQKSDMYFQWRNSNNTQVHRLGSDGSAIWNGNASSYTEIRSNTKGQYIRQYANDGTTSSWLIRGYADNGIQAIFHSGGIQVNGTVKTKEVNVTATGWADYVFKPEYQLMPLSELETFIRKNGHLPDVPTEAEVMEKGVNLAEMNVKLLEKVEELSLYIISLEKRIQILEDN